MLHIYLHLHFSPEKQVLLLNTQETFWLLFSHLSLPGLEIRLSSLHFLLLPHISRGIQHAPRLCPSAKHPGQCQPFTHEAPCLHCTTHLQKHFLDVSISPFKTKRSPLSHRGGNDANRTRKTGVRRRQRMKSWETLQPLCGDGSQEQFFFVTEKPSIKHVLFWVSVGKGP